MSRNLGRSINLSILCILDSWLFPSRIGHGISIKLTSELLSFLFDIAKIEIRYTKSLQEIDASTFSKCSHSNWADIQNRADGASLRIGISRQCLLMTHSLKMAS